MVILSTLLKGGKTGLDRGSLVERKLHHSLKVESLISYKDEKSAQVDSIVQDNNIDDVVVESKTSSTADANIFEPEISVLMKE
jgi:hypothetical protein